MPPASGAREAGGEWPSWAREGRGGGAGEGGGGREGGVGGAGSVGGAGGGGGSRGAAPTFPLTIVMAAPTSSTSAVSAHDENIAALSIEGGGWAWAARGGARGWPKAGAGAVAGARARAGAGGKW